MKNINTFFKVFHLTSCKSFFSSDKDTIFIENIPGTIWAPVPVFFSIFSDKDTIFPDTIWAPVPVPAPVPDLARYQLREKECWL